MTLRIAPLAAILLLFAMPCFAGDLDEAGILAQSTETLVEIETVEVTTVPTAETAANLTFPLDFAKSLEVATSHAAACALFPCISDGGCRNNCLSRNCATFRPQCFSGYCFCDLR